MNHRQPGTPARPRARRLAIALRLLLAALLGVAAAVMISCGGAGTGLIPAANAGPLRTDFEKVEQTAESGDGDCTATEAALVRTEQDFSSLPGSVDTELSNRLHQGITNLRKQSLELCQQPTTKTTTTETTTTDTTPTETTTTPTETTSTPSETEPETEEPSGPAGGTPAPGEGEEESAVGENGGASAQEGLK